MSDQAFYDSTVEAQLLNDGVYVSTTRGTSMRPLFKTNRDVIILKTPDAEPKMYDVVLYRTKDGKYILHRIIAVKENVFIIRGDNTFVREKVAKDRILAVLTEYNRKGKKHSTSDLSFRIYSRLWHFIYPVRFLVHKALSFARKVYRKLFKRSK